MESSGFDPKLAEELIANQHQEHQDEIRQLLLNTHYLTKDYVISEARRLVKNFVESRDNTKSLGIFVDVYKIGSKHWLIKECADLLPKYVLVKENSNITADEILYLDDVVLTGHQCLGMIDFYSYSNDVTKIDLKIIIVCIHESNELLRGLPDVGGRFKSMNISVGKKLGNFKVSGKFGRQKCNVHMEYKIPNTFCVYERIYSMCRSPPDRSFMIDVEKFYSE